MCKIRILPADMGVRLPLEVVENAYVVPAAVADGLSASSDTDAFIDVLESG
jgi:hypothetical protein